MDNNFLALLIILLLVIAALIGIYLFRRKAKASIQTGPLPMHFAGDGKPAETPLAPTPPVPAPLAPAPALPAEPAALPAEPPAEPSWDVEISNVKIGGKRSPRDEAVERTELDQIAPQGDANVERSRQNSAPKG